MDDVSTGLLERAKARVGTVLRDKWRLDRLLGIGGMASVYAATHRNGSRGAIKMLHTELSIDADIKRRFLREGYVANAVEHPGTVRVLDDDVSEDGAVFIVMELLDGETLEAYAERRGGRIGPDEVLPYVDQLLEVLGAAHAKGVVHRDIKPENVFVTRTGQVKLLDFGIARLRRNQGSMATVTGATFGTPAFMPPEQALGRTEQVEARSDLWAVGASLFTLLSGRAVHITETLNEQLVAHAATPAPSLATAAPWLPPAIIAVVDRAMSFDEAGRWQSAAEMREALRRARGGIYEAAVGAAPQATPFPGPALIGGAPTPGPARLMPVAPSVAAVTAVTNTEIAYPGRGPRAIVLVGAAAGALAMLAGLFFVTTALRSSHPDTGAHGAGPTHEVPTATAMPVLPPSPAPTVEAAPSAKAGAAPSATASATPSATASAAATTAPSSTPTVQPEPPKPPSVPAAEPPKPPPATPRAHPSASAAATAKPTKGSDWLDRQH